MFLEWSGYFGGEAPASSTGGLCAGHGGGLMLPGGMPWDILLQLVLRYLLV